MAQRNWGWEPGCPLVPKRVPKKVLRGRRSGPRRGPGRGPGRYRLYITGILWPYQKMLDVSLCYRHIQVAFENEMETRPVAGDRYWVFDWLALGMGEGTGGCGEGRAGPRWRK